jgi:hypothetical protein
LPDEPQLLVPFCKLVCALEYGVIIIYKQQYTPALAARAVKITDEEPAQIGIGLPNDWVNFGYLKRHQIVSAWVVNEEFRGWFLKGRIVMDCTVSFMIMDDLDCHTVLMGQL